MLLTIIPIIVIFQNFLLKVGYLHIFLSCCSFPGSGFCSECKCFFLILFPVTLITFVTHTSWTIGICSRLSGGEGVVLDFAIFGGNAWGVIRSPQHDINAHTYLHKVCMYLNTSFCNNLSINFYHLITR